jgi:hypothetical protein
MTLISSNTKTNILTKLDEIVNIEDPEWSNLGIDLKLKIVHNLCNFLKNNINLNLNSTKQIIQSTSIKFNSFDIPLKNQRPKKIIEFGGINEQSNTELFDEFKKNIITTNKEFRKTFNSKNKNYCFANLSYDKYQSIINNYNFNVYNFINKNIEKIDSNKLFNNLIGGNQQKIICSNNKSNLKINKITHIDEFLNIEFNNDISIKLELYLTSEKITSNIPAKYKIFLTNIF